MKYSSSCLFPNDDGFRLNIHHLQEIWLECEMVESQRIHVEKKTLNSTHHCCKLNTRLSLSSCGGGGGGGRKKAKHHGASLVFQRYLLIPEFTTYGWSLAAECILSEGWVSTRLLETFTLPTETTQCQDSEIFRDGSSNTRLIKNSFA